MRRFAVFAGAIDFHDDGLDGGRCPVTHGCHDHCRQRDARHAETEQQEPERELRVVVEHAGSLSAAVVLPEDARAVEDDPHQ